jgi:3-hydroxyisobutyrate dehydrogenase-like beta-hydroxyacid dehydrogenase
MSLDRPRVGFIGLGMMGRGMARNLLRKGFPLMVLGHRRRETLDALLAEGAVEADGVGDLAQRSDVIVICVTGSPEVEAIMFDQGLIARAHVGLTVIDCSTAEPASTHKIAAALAAKGARFVDAPLARTPVEAEAGKLNTMVGADEAVFREIRPVLEAFCENIVHCGPVGHGHTAKLIYNLMSMGIAALTAEALSACAAAGVSLEVYKDLVSKGGANSGIFQLMVPKALTGDFTGLPFSIANAQKDLRYYAHLAEALPIVSLMGAAVHQSFVQASNLGFADRLVPSLIEAQEKLNGLEIVRR